MASGWNSNDRTPQVEPMQAYGNRGGESGVAAFSIGARAIVVAFRDGGTYEYDYRKPGRVEVEAMKALARSGRGLATYINRHVGANYARRLA